jgi:hypothetical protein
MEQAKKEEFQCSGCGQRFNSRAELEEHSKECAETQASSRPKTKSAGGQTRQP